MKRLLLLPLLGVLSLTMMTSCIKDYVTEEHIHQYYEGSKIYTTEYTIDAKDWQKGDFNGRQYLYCTMDNTDITPNVMDKGAVFGYMWTLYNNENYCWSPLPYVYPLIVDNKTVPENIRIEIEEGLVTFIIEELDAKEPFGVEDTMYFKVVVMTE